MKISESWLREWVPTQSTVDELAEQLTMAGLEVDSIDPAAPELGDVRIGRISRCSPHPQAGRLKLCEVDIGEHEPLPIVCGAPNARTGAIAPVALVGTILPGGAAIEAAEIRGVASNGMLCSASELGFAVEPDGLWLLDDDAPVGQLLADYLGLPDRILDIDLTPNRGDCLSIRGVAREVAVAQGRSLTPPAILPVTPIIDAVHPVHIEAPTRCVGYAARCVHGITAGAATPLWMRERLRRAGIRHINLPVDIGNFVMVELGQPMHAFDGDKLIGEIRVRMARASEHIETLDGDVVTLSEQTLVIADERGPVAIAGIIGGLRTAVDGHTRNVVFESACFTPGAVAGQGRIYKIHTDALHRFERGVDPELHPRAMTRATALLLDLGGGAAGALVQEHGDPLWAGSREIELRAAHIDRLLGQAIEADWVTHVLEALGMDVASRDSDHWRVSPPSWRYDLVIEADLIEEIARVYGYNRLQAHAQGVQLPKINAQAIHRPEDRWHAVLGQRGYSEAITYSFVEPGLHAALAGEIQAETVALDNPISEQYVEMRRTLWASLLPAWHYNVRRQQPTIRLYESGLRFVRDGRAEHGIAQIPAIAGVLAGAADDSHWNVTEGPVDFFDAKGDVEALFAGLSVRPVFEPAEHPALHPGRTARIMLGDDVVGWLGQLSPNFEKDYKNRILPYLFEIDSWCLQASAVVRFEAISEHPRVRRDLALVVADEVPVAALVSAIESVEEPTLQSIDIFDVFRGEGLETGFKSVALSLIFQDKASTLRDRDVDTIIARIIAALNAQCDARIRGG